jgi:hypothetical protein
MTISPTQDGATINTATNGSSLSVTGMRTLCLDSWQASNYYPQADSGIMAAVRNSGVDTGETPAA